MEIKLIDSKSQIRCFWNLPAVNKIVNGLGRTVDDWLAEMFTHVQNHYHHDTLQHKINFEVDLNIFIYSIYSVQWFLMLFS